MKPGTEIPIGLQEIIVRRDGFDMGAEITSGLGYETVFRQSRTRPSRRGY